MQPREIQRRGGNKMRIRGFEIDDVDIIDGVCLVGFAGRTAADQHDFLVLRRRHHHTRRLIAQAAPAFAWHRHGLDRVLRDIEDTGFNLQFVVHPAAVEKDPAVAQQK